MAFARTFWRRENNEDAALRRDFWRKLRGIAARLPFAQDLLAAYYCAFDRETPLAVKASLIGALAYFVLPADAIPDVLPVIGFTDDAAVLATAIKLVSNHIRPEHRAAAKDKLDALVQSARA
ncbi:MAG TPA: YkvA family protein [Pseudolabrys sp.]